VVTAHLGSFETGVAALRMHEDNVHVVFVRDNLSGFESMRSAQRRRLGVHEAPIDDGWRTWMKLRDALRTDHVVMLQGDRVMPGQRGVVVPFLDGHIEVPSGPVKLALASGAPIVPIFAITDGRGGIDVHIEAPIEVERPNKSILPCGNLQRCLESTSGSIQSSGSRSGGRGLRIASRTRRRLERQHEARWR